MATRSNTKKSKNTMKETSIDNTDLLKTVFNKSFDFLSTLIKQIYSITYPYLNDIYKKTSDKSDSCDSSKKNTLIQKNFIQYIPLIFELYFMMFHIFIVRLWIMLNFACTAIYMYNNVTDIDIKKRAIPVGLTDIKKFASFVIAYGILLMVFFTSSIGFICFPLMIYLINRTSKNILKMGF